MAGTKLRGGFGPKRSMRADAPARRTFRGARRIRILPVHVKISVRSFLLFLLLFPILLSPAGAIAERAAGALESPEERLRVRGVNYIPSYAASAREIWTAFDPQRVDQELRWAASLGFNAVRTPLSYDAYREAPASFLEHFRDFLGFARGQGLQVMPVFFDGWGTAEEDELGGGWQTLADAYARIQANPAAYRMDAARLKQFETLALELRPERQVPLSRDPAVLLWWEWRSTPSPEKIAPEYWAVLQNYVTHIVREFAQEESILAWDLMNNPAAGSMWRPREDLDQAERFVTAVFDWARQAGATQPITVSYSGGYGSMGPLVNQLDVLSAHSHGGSLRDMTRTLLELEAIGQDRPVLMTCVGGVLLPSTAREAGEEAQARRIRAALEAGEARKSGWFLWHLIEGEGPCPWDGLLRRDGSPKAAAEHVKQKLRRMR